MASTDWWNKGVGSSVGATPPTWLSVETCTGLPTIGPHIVAKRHIIMAAHIMQYSLYSLAARNKACGLITVL